MLVEEYFKQVAEENRIRAAKPWFIRVPLNAMDFIWYRVILGMPDIPYKLKMWCQRKWRGYDQNDVYNINSFIIDKLHDPLHDYVKYQSEHGKTLPVEFATDPAAWLNILHKIWYAVDDYWKTDHVDGYSQEIMDLSVEKQKQHEERVKEGFELLGKYLRELWD